MAWDVEATGAAVLAVVGTQGGPLQWQLPWLVTAAVAIVLVSFGLSEMVLKRNADESTHPVISPLLKILGGTGALMVGAVGGDYIRWAVLSSLITIVLVQIIYGSLAWISPYSLVSVVINGP